MSYTPTHYTGTFSGGRCIESSTRPGEFTNPAAAGDAIATADVNLQNATLPTYTELLEALRRLSVCYDRYSATGRRHEIPAVNASAMLDRHDRALAGDFKA